MTGHLDGLSDRQFRWVDAGSKLLGVGVVAVGLETGIETAPGLALIAVGVLLGVSTAVHTEDTNE